jgi:hypothetical protein
MENPLFTLLGQINAMANAALDMAELELQKSQEILNGLEGN